MSEDANDTVGDSRRPLDESHLRASLTWPSGPLARLTVVPSTESTNNDALAALRGASRLPHLSAFLTDHQTAGRGRAGRTWETPAGTSLTASVVLRPEVARASFGWVPLIVGLAVVRAFAALGMTARLKWPNDVVAETDDVDDIPGWGTERKVAGILCEVEDDAVVAGFGINVSQDRDELPVPHASSMRLAGALSLERAALFGRVVRELDALITAWERDPSSARELVERVCSTIGRDVTADVPGATPISGRAIGLSDEGGLDLRLASGETRTILAGDVRIRAVS